MDRPRLAVETLPGPYGPYHLATSAQGVVAAEWLTSVDDFGERVGRRRRADVVPGHELPPNHPARRRLDAARPIVERLLAGEPADGRAIPLDLRDRPEWDQRVLLAVQELGFGETASYGDIARRVGAPRAARAVGGAMGRNPVTLIVPCHRVIAADGSLGGYGGDGPFERHDGLRRKRDLLLREGVTVAERSR
jgi:methylated-DNA-[protein]-cysteine S-methyltransferase